MSGEDFKEGIIVKMDNDFIWVSVEQKSACSGCHAKGYCTSTDCKDRVIKLNRRNSDKLSVGDCVRVGVSSRVGFMSVFIAFVVPVIVMFFTVYFASFDSKYVAVLTVFTVFLYFFIIYLLKNIINRFIRIEYKIITNDLQ